MIDSGRSGGSSVARLISAPRGAVQTHLACAVLCRHVEPSSAWTVRVSVRERRIEGAVANRSL
eukprot:7376206-Prymnesium_polylepis.4